MASSSSFWICSSEDLLRGGLKVALFEDWALLESAPTPAESRYRNGRPWAALPIKVFGAITHVWTRVKTIASPCL